LISLILGILASALKLAEGWVPTAAEQQRKNATAYLIAASAAAQARKDARANAKINL
jgi:uncharacterized protein HemY